MRDLLNSREFAGMSEFLACVYLARLGMNVVEGRPVMQSDLMLLVAGVVVSMYVRDKRLVLAAAVAMVVVVKMSLVVREGFKEGNEPRCHDGKTWNEDKKECV